MPRNLHYQNQRKQQLHPWKGLYKSSGNTPIQQNRSTLTITDPLRINATDPLRLNETQMEQEEAIRNVPRSQPHRHTPEEIILSDEEGTKLRVHPERHLSIYNYDELRQECEQEDSSHAILTSQKELDHYSQDLANRM